VPQPPEGTREPTTTWPIQKYLWSDFAVRGGDAVQIGAPGADARSQAYDTRRLRELDFWFGKR